MSTISSATTSSPTVSNLATSASASVASGSAGSTSPSLSSLKDSIENLQASDESVLTTLNSVLTSDKSSPEMRQMALRFFQERQEKESLLSQVVRAMGDTAMRIIANIR